MPRWVPAVRRDGTRSVQDYPVLPTSGTSKSTHRGTDTVWYSDSKRAQKELPNMSGPMAPEHTRADQAMPGSTTPWDAPEGNTTTVTTKPVCHVQCMFY